MAYDSWSVLIVILIAIIILYILNRRFKNHLETFDQNLNNRYYWQNRDHLYRPLVPKLYNVLSKYDYPPFDIPLTIDPLRPFIVTPNGSFEISTPVIPTDPMLDPTLDIFPDQDLFVEAFPNVNLNVNDNIVLDKFANPNLIGYGDINGDKTGLSDIGTLNYAQYLPYDKIHIHSNYGRSVADLRPVELLATGNNITTPLSLPLLQYAENGYHQFPTPLPSKETSDIINSIGTGVLREHQGDLEYLANNCVVPMYPNYSCTRFNYY
jgi:hypothetical protein